MRLGSTIWIGDTPDFGNFHGGLAFGHFESMEFTQETGLARTWLRCDKGCVPRARPCHLSVRNACLPEAGHRIQLACHPVGDNRSLYRWQTWRT